MNGRGRLWKGRAFWRLRYTTLGVFLSPVFLLVFSDPVEKRRLIREGKKPLQKPMTPPPTSGSPADVPGPSSRPDPPVEIQIDDGEESDDFYDEYQAPGDEEPELAPPLTTKGKARVEKLFVRAMAQAKNKDCCKALATALPRPANMVVGQVPRTNSLLWETMSTLGRQRDTALQKIQLPMMLANNAMVRVLDDSSLPKGIRRVMGDAVYAQAIAYTLVHEERKRNMTATTSEKVKSAIKRDRMKTEMFGEQWIQATDADLLNQLATAAKSAEVLQKLTNPSSKWKAPSRVERRYQPYPNRRESADVNRFLEGGRRQQYHQRRPNLSTSSATKNTGRQNRNLQNRRK